ncbi:MAG: hypothetical protein C4576_30775 [Desulfobacteraceae bacterium]|nr:MAG: hypothetical protein C4576_30775 [Desulfobacteraceae bacterium]
MDIKTLKYTPSWEWPENAHEIFLGILRDKQSSESDRQTAVELAGDLVVMNDELADELLFILEEESESELLRSRAAISLGPVLEQSDLEGFDDPAEIPITEQTFERIRETLRKLYMDADVPMKVRRRILEASVRSPQKWHRDAIRDAYKKGEDDWKLTAVFCMRYVRGFDKQIIESLESSDPDIEYEAVCAAGTWGLKGAWSHIVSLVTSEDTEKSLLIAAIEAVPGIRPKQTAEVLDELLDSDDEDIVDAVHEALAMAGEPWEEEDETLH